jgi:hypothetical protein
MFNGHALHPSSEQLGRLSTLSELRQLSYTSPALPAVGQLTQLTFLSLLYGYGDPEDAAGYGDAAVMQAALGSLTGIKELRFWRPYVGLDLSCLPQLTRLCLLDPELNCSLAEFELQLPPSCEELIVWIGGFSPYDFLGMHAPGLKRIICTPGADRSAWPVFAAEPIFAAPLKLSIDSMDDDEWDSALQHALPMLRLCGTSLQVDTCPFNEQASAPPICQQGSISCTHIHALLHAGDA